MTTNKRNQIIARIQEHGEGYQITAREVVVLACETETSMQYVRKVRADLRATGVLDDNNCFVGRWVKPEELAAYLKVEDDMRVGLILSEARKSEMARHFQTTPSKLYQALRWAIATQQLSEYFSFYGWHVMAA